MSETRTHWKDVEWQAVCEELFKLKPIECRSSTLVGVTASDMFKVMYKVLPKGRWRKTFNMTKTRPKLIEQMGLYIQIRDAAAANAVKALEQQEQDKKSGERKVLTPLAELMAEMIFEQLKPMLNEYLASMQIGKPQIDAPISMHRESTAHTKLPKIGVIGLLPIQTESLKSEFPQLDFKFVEKGTNSEEVRGLGNMDAVFGLTQKMAHNAEYTLRKTPAWLRYHRVSGRGTTSVKRAIQVWLSAATN